MWRRGNSPVSTCREGGAERRKGYAAVAGRGLVRGVLHQHGPLYLSVCVNDGRARVVEKSLDVL